MLQRCGAPTGQSNAQSDASALERRDPAFAIWFGRRFIPIDGNQPLQGRHIGKPPVKLSITHIVDLRRWICRRRCRASGSCRARRPCCREADRGCGRDSRRAWRFAAGKRRACVVGGAVAFETSIRSRAEISAKVRTLSGAAAGLARADMVTKKMRQLTTAMRAPLTSDPATVVADGPDACREEPPRKALPTAKLLA